MPQPHVESYNFGHMVVDGQEHTNDLILLPDRVIPNWWCDQGHRLSAGDLEQVVDAQPEVLVVGTGASGVMDVPAETRRAVEEAGIELHVARTGQAWKRYNQLQEERPTAGAFHLTC
ncbi:MAG: Mth938-like domain-containing protein [Chloroflexota bacterium]